MRSGKRHRTDKTKETESLRDGKKECIVRSIVRVTIWAIRIIRMIVLIRLIFLNLKFAA